MKTKRILALVSALAMLGALTSCKGKDQPAPESSADSSEATTTAEVTTEATTEATTTVTTTPPEEVPAPIDKNAITFDQASFYTAHAMGSEDEAPVDLAIVDLDGDKKLRVHVKRDDETKDFGVPKIVFDLADLVGVENTGKIDHFSVDFTCIARGTFKGDDGTDMMVIGNFLGTLGGNIASEKKRDEEDNLIQNDWAQQDFKFENWDTNVKNWHFETKSPLLPANRYAENDKGVNLVIMRWGQPNDVDFYIDNLTIWDKDGNSLPILYDVTVSPAEVVEDTIPDDPNVDDLDAVEQQMKEEGLLTEGGEAPADESSEDGNSQSSERVYDSDGFEEL